MDIYGNMSMFEDHIAKADNIILERFELGYYTSINHGKREDRTYLIDKIDPGTEYKHTSYIILQEAWENYIAGKQRYFAGFLINYQPRKQTYINKLSRKVASGDIRILVLNGETYYNVGDLLRFENDMDLNIILRHREHYGCI